MASKNHDPNKVISQTSSHPISLSLTIVPTQAATDATGLRFPTDDHVWVSRMLVVTWQYTRICSHRGMWATSNIDTISQQNPHTLHYFRDNPRMRIK